MIAGSPLVLPSPAEIPARMGDFARWLAAAAPGPETAFEANARLVTIHPFADGNGRTARLFMNLILLKAGYPPVVVGPEHREGYIDALQALQLRGDPEPYRRSMAVRLNAGLDHYLEIAAKELEPGPGEAGESV